MEKEEKAKVYTKAEFPETDDYWLFKYDNTKKITEQLVHYDQGFALLNVRKAYTNDIYWGVFFTTMDKQGTIFHNFRCKDRGFPEALVDDKDHFLEIYKKDLIGSVNRNKQRSQYKSVNPDFYKEYDVSFMVDSNNNYYATTAVVENSLVRGLYGSVSTKSYEEKTKEYGISVLNRFPTKEEVKTYIIDKQTEAINSNFITHVSTAYSKIIIEHPTQYEKEWSDIKRREKWERKIQQ